MIAICTNCSNGLAYNGKCSFCWNHNPNQPRDERGKWTIGQQVKVPIKGAPYNLTKTGEGWQAVPLAQKTDRFHRVYHVHTGEEGLARRCTCPDFMYRKGLEGGCCKHMEAVNTLERPPSSETTTNLLAVFNNAALPIPEIIKVVHHGEPVTIIKNPNTEHLKAWLRNLPRGHMAFLKGIGVGGHTYFAQAATDEGTPFYHHDIYKHLMGGTGHDIYTHIKKGDAVAVQASLHEGRPKIDNLYDSNNTPVMEEYFPKERLGDVVGNSEAIDFKHHGELKSIHINPHPRTMLKLLHQSQYKQGKGIVDSEGNKYFWIDDEPALHHWKAWKVLADSGLLDEAHGRGGDRYYSIRQGKIHEGDYHSDTTENVWSPVAREHSIETRRARKKQKPPPKHHPGSLHGSKVRVVPVKQRVFSGKPIQTRTTLSKQETGRIGEAIILAYLRDIEGRADARPMNIKSTNFPVDIIEDSAPTEVKAGLVSNSPKAQQWRLTFSKESKQEKELYDKMTPEQRREYNEGKQQRIHERKQQIIKQLEKKTGRKIKPRTICAIINPDTKAADIYSFQGFHDRVGYNSAMAKKAYVATVSYDHLKTHNNNPRVNRVNHHGELMTIIANPTHDELYNWLRNMPGGKQGNSKPGVYLRGVAHKGGVFFSEPRTELNENEFFHDHLYAHTMPKDAVAGDRSPYTSLGARLDNGGLKVELHEGRPNEQLIDWGRENGIAVPDEHLSSADYRKKYMSRRLYRSGLVKGK